MDYEKAYDEALERARKLYNEAKAHEYIQDMEDYEMIFPGLKESEDERIRKALVRFHKSTIDVDGIKGEEILAWLEKQGETDGSIKWHSVLKEPEEMRELLCEWDSNDSTWHEVAFYHSENETFWNGERQVEHVTKWCYIDELFEKQGEKKHTWSEEDEEYLRRAINATKDGYPMTTKWLKSLKERLS